jgi:xanthine dehydrogenase accessory factor
MRDVLRRLIESLEQNRELIFCQVVETRGSTPQKAGAVMAVDIVGGQVGTLGGGCVENEVKQNAIRQIGSSGAIIQSFVLDHDYAWNDGLICGGKMTILTEVFKGPEPLAYFREMYRLLEAGDGFTEVVVLSPDRLENRETTISAGQRFLFGPVGTCQMSWPVGPAPATISAMVVPLSERPRPSARSGVAMLPTLPRVRLVIVGAGHVGQAVAALAAQADFDVWVIDDRKQYANEQ